MVLSSYTVLLMLDSELVAWPTWLPYVILLNEEEDTEF